MTGTSLRGRRFMNNFLLLSAAEVLSKGLSFVATVHLARVLGAEGFGIVSFCNALLFYFMLSVNGGFDLLGMREITRHRASLRQYVENILAMRLVLAALALCLLMLCSLALFKTPAAQPILRLYGLTLFSYALSVGWAFQATARVGVVAIGNIGTQLIFAGAVLWLVNGPLDLWRVPVAQFTAELCAMAIIAAKYRHAFGALRCRCDPALWKFIWLQGLPIGLSLMMSVIMLNLDAVILGFMKGPQVVGWYSAAYRLVLLLLGFNTLYHMTLLPLIAQYARGQHDQVKTLIGLSLRVTAMLAVPLGVGGVFMARPLMEWAYGESYARGVPALQILICGVTFTVIRLHYRNTLLAFDEQKTHLKLVIFGALINTALNFMLIPKLSLIGAAIATTCAEAIILWKAAADVKRQVTAIPFLAALGKPALAASVMALSLAFIPAGAHLFLRILAGAGIYFAVLFMLNGISLKDIRDLYGYVQTQ
ncbi:MAG: flippase [Acidobacteria bacterium]|nr:flippase [Acidobacteriota bacterium]MBI3657608.1 flippase [Acidobacteriota bacterium]